MLMQAPNWTDAVVDRQAHPNHDEEIETLFYTPLRRRRGVSQSLFDNHWKNAHGPLCARLPGLYHYVQYHLAHDEGGLWPSIDGIDRGPREENQLDGVAILAFASMDDRQTWAEHSDILMADEQNAFEETIGYETNAGASTTFLDRRSNPAPNGDGNEVSLQVLLKKQDGVAREAFHDYLLEDLLPSFADSDLLTRLRAHPLEAYDNSEDQPPAPNVSHDAPPEEQPQAALEISFEDRVALNNFFDSPAYTQTVGTQPEYIRQIDAFPVRNTYTFNYGGEMTLAGHRGSTTARDIRQIGAVNQMDAETLEKFGSPE